VENLTVKIYYDFSLENKGNFRQNDISSPQSFKLVTVTTTIG